MSLEPASADDEFRPLDSIVGDASFVGLGESVHTSGGFYRAKFRLFKYLVENHGFRAFAFETPWPAAEAIGRFVDTCEGDARAVTKAGLFAVFAAVETQAIFEWMCGWNKSHPQDKLVAFGFDVQQPEDDAPALRTFLTKVAGEQAAALIDGFATCAPEYVGKPIPVTAKGHQECLTGLDRVSRWFDENTASITAQTSPEALGYARLHTVGLRSWELRTYHHTEPMAATGGQPDSKLRVESRDEGMATVLQAMRNLKVPGKKVAVWAHDFHLAYASDRAIHSRTGRADGIRSMGTFLRAAIGSDYVAIGITAHDVFINWPGFEGTPPPAAAGSLERQLRARAFDRPFLIVDTRPSEDPQALIQPGETFKYGLAGMDTIVPAEQFGAIFYLQSSPAMTSLVW